MNLLHGQPMSVGNSDALLKFSASGKVNAVQSHQKLPMFGTNVGRGDLLNSKRLLDKKPRPQTAKMTGVRGEPQVATLRLQEFYKDQTNSIHVLNHPEPI
jgi:hypothetical protein